MHLLSIDLVHKTLYMFQAVPLPIIRSTKLYIYSVRYCQTNAAAIVEKMELHGVPSLPREQQIAALV